MVWFEGRLDSESKKKHNASTDVAAKEAEETKKEGRKKRQAAKDAEQKINKCLQDELHD